MVRKKRAWNNTNPLYRYLKRKNGTATRRSSGMARRRSYARSFGRRYGRRIKRGGGIIMNGLLGSKIPGGLIGKVAFEFLYTKFVSPMVPKMIPMQSALTESGAVGGLPAAAGSFIAGSLAGSSGSTGSW